ncbi:MAG: allophanate hydrolase subunit 1 [Rhodobacteraceae bacterium]|nr:allophanate hydrolase subunit 1 [Paracoccaceae bacterium]
MHDTYPLIRDAGLTGMLVTFAPHLSEPANRAALAFRTAVEAETWAGVEETATTLASVFVRFDPLRLDHDSLRDRLAALAGSGNWLAAPLPHGRKLWRIPVAIGGEDGPQFLDAAQAAGLDPDQARTEIAAARVRVLTIGYAPGQPYLGELPEHWNIPRLTKLNPKVPGGSLVVAIRQLIIFAGPSPTGWHHVGQTAFECFRPGSDNPFALTPGDEVTFREITPAELADIRATDHGGNGGATCEVLP